MKTNIAVALFVLALGISGCERQGPAERAGKAVDDAVDKAGDKIEDAGDRLKDKTDH